MFRFLREVGDAVKSGNRAGNVVKITQKVIGRPLSSSERNDLKEFHDNMNYQDGHSEAKIAIDYFYFLLGEGKHPSGLSPHKMQPDAKKRLVETIHTALAWGTLPLGQGFNSTEQITEFVKDLRNHAGLDYEEDSKDKKITKTGVSRSSKITKIKNIYLDIDHMFQDKDLPQSHRN